MNRLLLVAVLACLSFACGGSTGAQGPAGTAGTAGHDGTNGQPGADGALAIYGDGSADAGVISTNTNWGSTANNLQFTDFTVNSGVTLTVSSGTVIRCTGTFTNNGTILVQTAAQPGFADDTQGSGTPSIWALGQPSAGIALAPAANGALMYGGNPVDGAPGGPGLTIPEAQSLRPGVLGGGGGGVSLILGYLNSDINYFGEGGGTLTVLAMGAVSNTGTIRADGVSGYDGSLSYGNGGGGGGVLLLASMTSISNIGTLSAQGGSGADNSPGAGSEDICAGGGGGGGIIHLLAPSVTAGTTTVAGGVKGPISGSPTGGSVRTSGGGGGGSGGAGGAGGGIVGTSFTAAGAGASGYTIVEQLDPTHLMWL
jgi:hypothetical protein